MELGVGHHISLQLFLLLHLAHKFAGTDPHLVCVHPLPMLLELFLTRRDRHLVFQVPLHFLILLVFDHLVALVFDAMTACIFVDHLAPEAILLFLLRRETMRTLELCWGLRTRCNLPLGLGLGRNDRRGRSIYYSWVTARR